MLALAFTASLAGCATESTCVDWVPYETAQNAYDDAELVVVGTLGEATGSTTLFGVDVPVHDVTVDEVIKGDSPGTLQIAGAPTWRPLRTCA